MEKIVIGFSTHKKWNLFSETIRLVDKTPYSHTYCVFHSDSLQRDLVYHAAKSFLHFLSLENFLKDNKVLYEFEVSITPEQKVALMQLCVDKAGLKYGLLAVAGVGLVKLAKLFGKDVENPFQDGGKTYYCSELVSCILDQLGLKTNPVNPEDASVSWLFKMLSQESVGEHSDRVKIKVVQR